MTQAARAWLAQPELARLWDKLHERLERNGIQIQGRITLADVGHTEREALSLLMGRAYSGERVTIALADLDQRLRSSAAGCGLADAVAELRGRLVDKPAARSARQAVRDQVWAAAGDTMRTTGLVSLPWAADWLAEARRNGTVSRLHPAVRPRS